MRAKWLFGIAVSFLMWCVPVVVVGQQDVFSRSEVSTGNWGDAQNPWNYQFDGNQGDPDNNNTVPNFIRFDHNNNLNMTLNGRSYRARWVIFESGATSSRTIGGEILDMRPNNGNCKIENYSSAEHTFNNNIALYDLTEINPVNGDLTFNGDIFNNNFFIEVFGVNAQSLTINGVIQGTGGLAVKQNSTVLLVGDQTYTGGTFVEAGTLTLGGAASSNTITGDISITGGTFNYVGAPNDFQIDPTSSINLESGTLNFVTARDDVASITMTGGNLLRGGNWITLNGASSFTGGSIDLSSGSSRIENQSELTLGNISFDYSAGSINNGALSIAGDVLVQDNANPAFTISNGGDPAIQLNNATRTFDVGNNAVLTIDWAIRSETASQGSLRKTGVGKILLNGQTEYTGQTIIEAGSIEVGSDQRIDDLSSLVMEGGTFSTGVPAGYNETIGELDLQVNSTIALGTGSHELRFAASNGVAWNSGAVITITGWSGSLGQTGTEGKIFVGNDESSLTQEQLNQIEFDGQGFAFLLPTGELVPRNPTFSVSETYLLPFSTPEGAPSDPAVFEVEASSLTTDITISAPAGFEMSLNAGGPYSNPLTIPVTDLAGDLPAAQVFTRLSGTQGDYDGDLTVSTSGLPDQTVVVAGRVLTPGSSVIKFDDGNWTAGAVGNLTTYATDHTYTEQDWFFTGGYAQLDGADDHDGFPGAYGTYSWRFAEDAVTWTGTFTNSGTINAFGFKVRRWDDDPSPDYEVAYSTNGGSDFTVVETIDNAYLENSSQWKVFEHELATPVSIGANDLVVRLSQTTGERIFIDDFSFDITPDDCANTTWYYRSVSSGSYTNKLTWEKSPDGTADWEPADCPPTENAAEVLVRDGHTVLVNTDLAIPTLMVEGNALLRVDAGIVDMSAGSITINSNGVLEFDGGEIPIFPSSGMGIIVEGTVRVSTAVSGISSALAGNDSSGEVAYADGSVFEWNTSGAAAFQTAEQTYFPDVNASTIPIFSIPQAIGIAGAGTNTIINGVLQVDGSMTWDNSGEKIIRNGITGNGTITQSTSSGLIRLTASIVELSGSGTLALNSNGLLIPAGVTVGLQSDKPVDNALGENGRIEIQGVLNDNGFGMPGDVDNVEIGSAGVINCTNPNGLIATNGTFGSTTGTYIVGENSLIDYQRPGDQDVTTVSDYGNLTIRGSGTKTITNGVTSVLGDLFIDDFAIISAAFGAELIFTNDFIVTGAASFDSGAFDNLALSTSDENIQNFDGNANPIRCLSFFSAKANGSLTLNGVYAVEVKGEWNTNYYSNGNFSNNGATLQVGGDMRIRGGDFDRYSITGTVRLTGETGSVQVFRGTENSPVSAVIENLIVGGVGSPNVDLASSGDYTFTGDISIENGQLNAFNNQINLAGNWNNYDQAGFNENVARLFLNGSTDQVITCQGGEIFSSLTVNNSTGNIVLNHNLSVTGTGSEIIDLNVGAAIDLGGNTLSFSGNNGENPGTFLRVSDGNVLITGATGSVFEVVNGRKEVLSLNGGALEFAENVTVNTKNGINFGSEGVSTIKGALEIEAGGFVLTNPPIYFTGSTLRYQSGGDYNRNAEWNSLSDEGLPHHIEITNSTNVFMSNEPIPAPGRLEIAGDLTIDDGKLYMGNNLTNGLDVKGSVSIIGTEPDSLYLGDNDGGDIRIGEDLVVSGDGVLFQNTREVEMNGTGNTQSITGVDSFDYLAINNSGGTVVIDQETTIEQRLRLLDGNLNNLTQNIVMSDGSLISRTAASATMNAEPTVVGGDQFNIEYSDNPFPTGNEFPSVNTAVANLSVTGPITTTLSGNRTFNGDLVLDGSNFDLNGNTLTARGRVPEPSNFSGAIEVRGGGTRNITGAPNSFFDITGFGENNPSERTKTVSTYDGGSLVFGSDVTVRIGDGQVDFGQSGGFYPTTINGTLEVLLGGSVGILLNPCYFGVGSLLRFANSVDFQVDSNSKIWTGGEIFSGDPGIPYDVEVGASTELVLNAERALRNNLTIINGTFTLTEESGTFELGGNWNRSGSSSEFNHDEQEVIFNGADPQTITTTDGVPSEVFYKLTFSGAGLKTLNEDITILDSLRLEGTGGLSQNDQTINLAGNWTNTMGESLFQENGLVVLNGTEGQVISSTDVEVFDELRVNNTSDLGDGIELADPISISGQLIMDRGLIHNEPGPDLTLTASASTNGGDYRSYVTGKIVKQGFATTDLVEFPVGYYNLNGGDTISVWQKAGLTPETADATAFSVRYFHENAVPGTSYPSNPPEVLSPLVAASTCNYWDIDRLSGDTDAKVRLHWNDSTTCFNIDDPNTLDVAHLNTSNVWESQGVMAQSVGYIESGFVGDFSPFTIGTTNGINVLPITLLDFSAEAKQNTVDVRWITSSEINNDFFTLERSLDAQHFEAIGTVDGAGNSNTPLYYHFSDDSPYPGISFYRLKQTDYDGTTTYSDIRMVRMDTDGSFELLKVFRAQDGLQLHYRSEVSLLNVEIIDLTGKRLFRKQIQNAGTTVIHPNLARGVYLLRLNNGTQFKIGKFFY